MIKVVSIDNIRKSDAHTASTSTTMRELMTRAGKGIFDAVDWKAPVAVVCGIGNNAGDGFMVAELLYEAGISCEVFLLSDKFTDDGKYFHDRIASMGIKMNYGLDALCLDGFNTVLDCIFGTGFKGEVEDPFRTAIERINASDAFVVSADINSGLDGNSGLAKTCVRSDLTVSLGYYKNGHFLNSAKDIIKEKVNCDIGVELLDEPAYLIEAEDIRRIFTNRPCNSNKGDYGYAALIGGSVQYSGAAKLANMALASLRSGAGVARLAVPENIIDAVLPYVLESTLFPLDAEKGKYCFRHSTTEHLMSRTTAAAIGMGMGRSNELKNLLEYLLLEYSGNLIVDADGLNVLSTVDHKRFKNASCNLILTPHPKEFERLCGEKFEEFRGDLVMSAKKYAESTGAIVVLKGATTVITNGKTTYLVDRGCAGMATAGSGDVLSGILAGICAYVSDEDLLLAAAAGVYLAGLAGEIAARDIPDAAMIASDTVKAIPAAIKEIIG